MTGLYLLILSIFSIIVTSVMGAQLLAMKWCSYFYYYSKATKDCTLCTDRCSPGTGLVRNCGYDDYGNRVAPACETCPSGYYSRIKRFNLIYRPAYPCARCRPCFPASRIKRSCSSTRDAKCARCPKGQYKHSDGHCYKCSYCCDGMLEKRINVVKSCRKRGMGRCSCRAYTNCYDGKDNNAQCYAYRLEALKLPMKKEI
eukprot:Seg3.16 transcript_id=Seg3.16/GoldUCD/mRNA.D3Y31 product="Tumor necrosis factor receptor superfamily member 16" protein_id=Seg3.16/GoldUCD/D3Y31